MAAKKRPIKKKPAKKKVGARGATGHGKTPTDGMLTVKEALDIKRRRDPNIAIRKQELRDRLSGMKLMESIERRSNELVQLSEDIKKAKNTEKNKTAIVTTINKSLARARIISVALDTSFRMLAKVLPDLKSIEVTDNDGNSVFTAFLEAVNNNQEGSK